MVKDKGIEPHVPIFEKGERSNVTFSRSDFDFYEEAHQDTTDLSNMAVLFCIFR